MMVILKRLFISFAVAFVTMATVVPASAQSAQGAPASGNTTGTSAGASSAAAVPDHPLSLPRGFQNLLLGLTLDEVKKNLESSPYFSYRGGPDVSLAPVSKEPIIQTPGVRYLTTGIFQFHDGRLYTITLDLNRQTLDYYTMFTRLSEEYGDPTSLSPSEAVWENSQVRMSLERPLTIKYIDRVVFDQIRAAGQAQQSLQELSRQEFINLF